MGSKLSRAVRPHVKADDLPVAPSHHDNYHANVQIQRQEPAPRLCEPFSYDDITVASSTFTSTPPQRCNSAPAQPPPRAATSDAMEQFRELTASFGFFLARHRLMSIEIPDDDTDTPATTLSPPGADSQQDNTLFEEPRVQCIICCNPLPNDKDPKYTSKVVKPCTRCASEYCTSCIRSMFIEACKDTTRMPPRCCVPIQLHHAKPHLTEAEITDFKAKYEEWLTPNPLYCPVPTCSTFVPERHLPEPTTAKGKRADSGIGTPASKTLSCPTCDADICLDCRQVAHPGSICNISEFGIDAETTELLKSWGYKKCPKCGHGLKRMYGCNHMECRCGAHFCYGCMGDQDLCGGECAEEEDDDYGSDYDPDHADESENSPAENGALVPSGEASEGTQNAPAIQSRNLDGGGHRYWQRQGLFFGEEPGDDYQDRSWNCEHSFSTYKISIREALVNKTSSTGMECVKCWCTIHPEIKTPSTTEKIKVKMASTGARQAPAGPQRGINRGRGTNRRGHHMAPHILSRANVIIGPTSYSSLRPSPLSQSMPDSEPSPMEDIQYSSERTIDIYGTILSTTEPEQQRSASTGHLPIVPDEDQTAKRKKAIVNAATSAVFTTPATKFSLAFECDGCSLLVCASCRDGTMAAQKARLEKERKDEERREEEAERKREALRVRREAESEESDVCRVFDQTDIFIP